MKSQGKYFRVLGKNHSLLPIHSFSSNPQELTQHIIKNKNYLYIDLSEQTGLKQMEAISADDAELDTERVGGNYVCNLRALSIQTQKAIDYLHKASNLQKLKDKYRDLLKREFSNRVSRASIKGMPKIGRRQKKPLKQKKKLETVTIYRGMNSNKLKTIIENRELQRKNQIILEKEKFLISKFGITNEYQTITNPKEKSPIIRKNGKVFLPGLKNTERTAYDTLQ